MVTIQSAMLIALGVFLAGFAVFLFAPFYRRRAARLATDALRRSMPLTEAEIRADKDRLRAEHAIAIHKLESKAEEQALSAARQMVEINRRDAAISSLESKVSDLKTQLEEHENARRVLEQTITDRLPRVENRLNLAKKQLFERDQEIAALTQSSNRYSSALEEATQINTQQRDEIHRLNATITTRNARNREPYAADARFDSEVALRAEIEALRTKTRDQSALISRLQGAMVNGTATGANGMGTSADCEVARLRDSLAEAERALRAAKTTASVGQEASSQVEAELRALKSANQDQLAEIAKLKAALKIFEDQSASDSSIADSKIAMKARLSALQAQSDQQAASIQSLRADVAAANEKLARQASQHADEMRRLGAGTLPASGPGRRDLPERSAPTLAQRISAPRPATIVAPASAASEPAAAAAAAAESDSDRVTANFMRALVGAAADTGVQKASEPQNGTSSGQAASDAESDTVNKAVVAQRRRPSLLERLTSAEKPAASGR